jgi:hypothetical protein
MIKYAQLIPANVRPASATNAQNAIVSSPSFFLALFIARYIAIPATSKPMVERIPKTMRSTLSGTMKLIYRKEPADAKKKATDV